MACVLFLITQAAATVHGHVSKSIFWVRALEHPTMFEQVTYQGLDIACWIKHVIDDAIKLRYLTL